jgi:signal transduction histidine kinase
MAGDAHLAAAGRRLVDAVAEHPVVRQQITDALVQSAADPGALLSLGSALLSGGGNLQDRAERALAGAIGALAEAAERAALAERVLALPEVRALLLELRPSALINTRLTDLVYQLVNAIQVKKRIDVTASLDEAQPLPGEVHVGFYRILQESLNNVVKHSHATAVTITFHSDGRQAALEVGDNGIGFETESLKSGLGLGVMRDRAQGIHADLQILSAPGNGTTIKVFWVNAAGEQTRSSG